MPSRRLKTSDDLLVCTACGAQYDEESGKADCRICDDPRQFVPSTGQSFTTLAQMRKDGFKNTSFPSDIDSRVLEIATEPAFGISQRACLLQTPYGNVLWDLVAYLDQETVDKINELGGLKLIVISHPHFYTTWADWSATFDCPVYLSKVDSVWANRKTSPGADLKLLTDRTTELLPGITAITCGGHFEGSLVLHWDNLLFVADTLLMVRSAQNPDPAKPGVTSYSFMWSIPNWIPLDPQTIMQIWRAIKPYEFRATFGVFKGANVAEKPGQRMSLKERVLQSAKIQIRAMGWPEHELLAETM